MPKHRSPRAPLTGGRSRRRPRRLPALLVAVAGVGTVSLMIGLVVLTLAPAALGWRSDVVLSGSMSPALEPGDVVVSAPVAAGQVGVGDVVVVPDPARPGRTLVHRVDSVRPDGTLVTRGDANASADSTTVASDEVLGRGSLRVPAVGLARLWLHQGRYLSVAAVLLVLAAGAWATVATAAAAVAAPEPGPRRPEGSDLCGPAVPARHRPS